MAFVVKNKPAMQETQDTWVQALGRVDPLEEGMAAHSSILAWRVPMDRGVWGTTVHGVAKNRTPLSDKAQVPPVPVLLGWEPHFENHCL